MEVINARIERALYLTLKDIIDEAKRLIGKLRRIFS
jgi:hypothetical protein